MKKKEENKKRISLIISMTLGSLLLIGLTALILLSNTPSEKVKRTLKKRDYTCIKDICSKKIDSTLYAINYKKATIKVDTLEFSYSYSVDSHNLNLKTEKYNCVFTKESITKMTLVDETFHYDTKCSIYTKNVNDIVAYFTELMDESNVNINDFEK